MLLQHQPLFEVSIFSQMFSCRIKLRRRRRRRWRQWKSIVIYCHGPCNAPSADFIRYVVNSFYLHRFDGLLFRLASIFDCVVLIFLLPRFDESTTAPCTSRINQPFRVFVRRVSSERPVSIYERLHTIECETPPSCNELVLGIYFKRMFENRVAFARSALFSLVS